MSLLEMLLLLSAIWALLHLRLAPAAKAQWSAVDLKSKVAKVGSLVVLEKVENLTGVGAITVGAVALAVLLTNWVGGAEVTWPKEVIAATASLYAMAKSLSEGYGLLLSVLGAVGAVGALWWEGRSAKARVTKIWTVQARKTVDNILSNADVLGNAREIPELQPLASAVDSAFIKLQAASDASADEAELERRREVVRSTVAALAIAIAGKDSSLLQTTDNGDVSTEASSSAGAHNLWRRTLSVVSSARLTEDLGLVRKPLATAVMALLFVSLIGWTAAPIANSLRLGLNNMRMHVLKHEAQRSLDQALSELPPTLPNQPNRLANLPPNAVQQAANLMARGIVHEMTQTSLIPQPAVASDVQLDSSELVRAALNEQTVDDAAPYADLRKAAASAVASPQDPAAPEAVEHVRKRVEPLLQTMADRDPHRLASLLSSLQARYGGPMSASDAQGKLTEAVLDRVFSAVDLKPGGALQEQAQDLAKEFGKKAVQTWVDAQVDRFMAHALSDAALPEVERAMFEARKPARDMLIDLHLTNGHGWSAPAATTKEASRAHSVADLVAAQSDSGASGTHPGGYDDLFPRSSPDDGGGGGIGGVDPGGGGVAVAAEDAAFAEARAVSFDLAASSFRVRGVIVGRALDGQPLNILDIRWRLTAPKLKGQATRVQVDLLVSGPNMVTPEWRPAGTYDAGVLNQALRYAADRRVIATTIVAGDGKTIERETSLHPVLSDTPLGCRVTAIDRVIDTLSFSGSPDQSIATFASDRQNMANWLTVARLTEAVAHEANCPVQDLTAAVQNSQLNSVRFSPELRQSLNAFVEQQARRAPGSQSFISRVDRCAGGVPRQLPACICAQTQTDQLPDRYWFPEDHTSQVREHPAVVTPDLAWLHPSVGHLDVFDFTTHTTFAIHSGPDGQAEENTATTFSFPPAQLVALRSDIIRRLPGFIAVGHFDQSYDDFMRPLEEFVLAQRLARAALDGRLGQNFPLAKLIVLERATRPYVMHQPTLRWEPFDPKGFYTLLSQKDADAAAVYRSYIEDESARVTSRKPMCGQVSG